MSPALSISEFLGVLYKMRLLALTVTHPNSRFDPFLKTYPSHVREEEHSGQYPVCYLAPFYSSCLTSDSHFSPAWFAVNMGTPVF